MSSNLDHEVYDFIRALTGSPHAKMSFNTFDDKKYPKSLVITEKERKEKAIRRKILTRVFHGPVKNYLQDLIRLNKKGAGVFATINETDGTGVADKNIITLRAAVLDMEEEPQITPPLAPSIVLRSKRGPHYWWLLNQGEPLEIFRTLQVSIAHYFGGDLSIKDLSRVMRVPGFLHQKQPDKPHLVTIESINPVRYSSWELLQAFPVHYPIKRGINDSIRKS